MAFLCMYFCNVLFYCIYHKLVKSINKICFSQFFLIKNFLWLWRLTYIQLNLICSDFKNRKTSPFYVVCAQIRWCKVITQVWLECYKAKIIYFLHKLSITVLRLKYYTFKSIYHFQKKEKNEKKKDMKTCRTLYWW